MDVRTLQRRMCMHSSLRSTICSSVCRKQQSLTNSARVRTRFLSPAIIFMILSEPNDKEIRIFDRRHPADVDVRWCVELSMIRSLCGRGSQSVEAIIVAKRWRIENNWHWRLFVEKRGAISILFSARQCEKIVPRYWRITLRSKLDYQLPWKRTCSFNTYFLTQIKSEDKKEKENWDPTYWDYLSVPYISFDLLTIAFVVSSIDTARSIASARMQYSRPT